MKDGLVGTVEGSKGLWMEDNTDLNPCWPTLLSGMCLMQFLNFVCIIDFGLLTNDFIVADEAVSSKGYVTFSLTNGPEYHISQVCFIKKKSKVMIFNNYQSVNSIIGFFTCVVIFFFLLFVWLILLVLF